MMKLAVAALAALAVAQQAVAVDGDKPILSAEMVETVRAAGASWTAEAGEGHRFAGWTTSEFQRLLGAQLRAAGEKSALPERQFDALPEAEIPRNFDSRDNWPHCPTMKAIRDQGHCGSCWAFGAVEALSDRFCVANIDLNVTLSANDILACCGSCGNGCDGGMPELAWQYFQQTGDVTESCDPYFDQKGCQHPGCEPPAPTPQCQQQCKNGATWAGDKHYVTDAYSIPGLEQKLQTEIMQNGPIEVAFTVYEDFAHYSHGIYHHVSGSMLGGHAVKMIGWGENRKGEKYWLIVNSWNKSWGMQGTFKIRRGTNECGIEESGVAGSPAKNSLRAFQF